MAMAAQVKQVVYFLHQWRSCSCVALFQFFPVWHEVKFPSLYFRQQVPISTHPSTDRPLEPYEAAHRLPRIDSTVENLLDIFPFR
jgi:hypothetical protein